MDDDPELQHGSPALFDPASLATMADPFRRYADLRTTAPVVPIASGRSGIFGYEAASFVLRDPQFRTGVLSALYASVLPPGALHEEMTHRINFLDPPDHPRVRRLVAKAFTPRRVGGLRPWVEAKAAEMVDSLLVDRDGTVEVMHGLAHQLPSLVISELLGVPVDLRDELTELSDAITPVFGTSVTTADRATAVAAAEVMHAVLTAELDARRRHPVDDLLSALVEIEDGDGNDERLSRSELLSLVATLYSAGHRTTRDLFGNGLDLLLRAGVAMADATDGAVVEELTRLATPTHYVARFPAADTEIDGVAVITNQPLMVFLAAANRDPAVYDEPDAFRPGRDSPPALSFALGAHFCLGAALARMEVEVMLGAFAARFPDARASGRERRWHQRGPFRGLDELVVQVRDSG